MKTADSIEQQEEKKSARDNSVGVPQKAQPSLANTLSTKRKKGRGDFSRIAAWAWKPGQSGNPSGRPKHDLAAEIARAIFEQNAEALYKAYCKAALKGNAYAFKELADRAYGKVKERHEVEVGPYREATDEQIHQRIAQLERQLGIERAVPALPPAPDSKPN
jgi:hypothetical protein